VSVGIDIPDIPDIPDVEPPDLAIPDMPDIPDIPGMDPDIPGMDPDIPGIDVGTAVGAGAMLADEALGGAVEKSQPGFGSTETPRSAAPSATTIRRPVVETSERSSGTWKVSVVSWPAGTPPGVTVTCAEATAEQTSNVPAAPSAARNVRVAVRGTRVTSSPWRARDGQDSGSPRTIDVAAACPAVPEMIMTKSRRNRAGPVITALARQVPPR
jgi:hypothetical protein